MSWWGRTVNRVSDSVKKFTSDPKRLALALGTAGGSEAWRAGKKSMEPSLPSVNIDQNARDQQSRLLADQMKTAQQFEAELPQYIEGEYGDRARGIKEEAKETQGALRSNLNARGMLHSGLRQAKEGKLSATTGGLLQSARGDVVRDATQRATAMKVDPALSAEASNQQQQTHLANLDQIQAQKDAFRAQMMGNAMGNIGAGVGRYYGDKK